MFTTGIVVRYHYTVRQLLGFPGHVRTFAGITVTAATENTNQFAVHMRSQCSQGIGQGIGSVGVINHHSDPIGTIESLKPARGRRESADGLRPVE